LIALFVLLHYRVEITIVKAIYAEFFTRFPEARALFKRVNIDNPDSGEYRAFLVRFATGIDTVINELDDTAVVAKQLEHLTNQHNAIPGMKKAYFEGMADAIERVLPQVSSCFNSEAWHRCFRRIVDKISAGIVE